MDCQGDAPANIPLTFEEIIKVGSTVKATTIHGVTHQGKVMAVDNKTALVILCEFWIFWKSLDDLEFLSDCLLFWTAVPTTNEASNGTKKSSRNLQNVVVFNLNTLQSLETVSAPSEAQVTPTALRLPDVSSV